VNLNNKTVFITGGSSGIGLEIAKALQAEGAKLMLCGTQQNRLDQAQALLGQACTTFVCDISERAQVDSLLDQVGPQVDVWINNAGIYQEHDLLKGDKSFEALERELTLDFTMPFYICQRLLPHLTTKPSAALVNITSGLAYTPSIMHPMYSAAKAALVSFTNSLRMQVERFPNLAIIEVAPPLVDTPMTATTNPKGIKKLAPQEVAKAVVAALKTGQTRAYPGMAKTIYRMSRLLPNAFTGMLNKEAREQRSAA
jgi:uncharacterized oxidoreductase